MLTDKQLNWLVAHNAKLEISVEPFEGNHTPSLRLRIDAADGCGMERKVADEHVPLSYVIVASDVGRQAILSKRVDLMIERLAEVC